MKSIFIRYLFLILTFLCCSQSTYYGKLEIDFTYVSEGGTSHNTDVVVMRNNTFHKNNYAFFIEDCSLAVPESTYTSSIANIEGSDIKVIPGENDLIYFEIDRPDYGIIRPVDGFVLHKFFIIVDSLEFQERIQIETGSSNYSIAHIFSAFWRTRYVESYGYIFFDKFQDGQLFGNLELQYKGILPTDNPTYIDTSFVKLKGIFTVPQRKTLSLARKLSKN